MRFLLSSAAKKTTLQRISSINTHTRFLSQSRYYVCVKTCPFTGINTNGNNKKSSLLPHATTTSHKYEFHTNVLQHEKIDFSQENTVKNPRKRYIIIGACAIVLFAILSEINYYLMPELSFGNTWRKWVYGDPFRNYVNMIRGKVLQLTLPKEYRIKETEADQQSGDTTTLKSATEDEERIIYISVERKFHLIVPKNFIPLGLHITEHNSNIRGYSSVSAKDIVGNQVTVEWQRAAPLFDKTQLSIYTPMKEALEHIAHYFVDQMNNVMDDVHVQRIEYLTYKHNDNNNNENGSPDIPDIVKPLDPVPFFKEKGVKHQDLIVVVTNAKKGDASGWQGHIFSIEYPYVYRMTVDLPEQVLAFGEQHREKPATEEELDRIAKSITKVPSLQQAVKNNFRFAPSDPKQISKLLRNQVLAIHYNSFFTVPNKQ